MLAVTFNEFLAQRVRELEADRARLRGRVRDLERSRDMWMIRAVGAKSAARYLRGVRA